MTQTTALSQELRKLTEGIMRQSMKGMLAFARDRNISLSQISVLMHLYYTGKSSVSDIAKKLGMTSAAASQLIKKLEQEHLVQRYEGTDDRRVRQIELGVPGRELVNAFIETRFQWLDDFSIQISNAKANKILSSIHELTEMMAHIK